MAHLKLSSKKSIDFASVTNLNQNVLVIGNRDLVSSHFTVPNINNVMLMGSVIVDNDYALYKQTNEWVSSFGYNIVVVDAANSQSIKFNPFLLNEFKNFELNVTHLSNLLTSIYYPDASSKEKSYLFAVVLYICSVFSKEEMNFLTLKNIMLDANSLGAVVSKMKDYIKYNPYGVLVNLLSEVTTLNMDELLAIGNTYVSKLDCLFTDEVLEITNTSEARFTKHIKNPVIYVQSSDKSNLRDSGIASLFINYYYDMLIGTQNNEVSYPSNQLYLNADVLYFASDFDIRINRLNKYGFITCITCSETNPFIEGLVKSSYYVLVMGGANVAQLDLVCELYGVSKQEIMQALTRGEQFLPKVIICSSSEGLLLDSWL